MNICWLLHATARTLPDAVALSLGEQVVARYSELSRRVARLAGGLHALDLFPGDRVALVMRNRPELIECLWACWHAGLVAVPISIDAGQEAWAHILRRTSAKACIADADIDISRCHEALALTPDDEAYARLTTAEPIPTVEVAAETPAWLFATSGTTSAPKIAVLSHRALLAMTWRYYADVGFLTVDDTMIHVAGLTHASGLYHIPHVARGSRNVIPAFRTFDASQVLALVAEHQNVAMIVSPQMLSELTRQAERSCFQSSTLRTLFYGSAPTRPAELKRAVSAFGPVLWQGYGQGETPMTISHLPYRMHLAQGHPAPWESRLASVGIARTGMQIRVVDEQGRDLPDGEIGEIICKSDVTMTGYWDDRSATAAVLVDGWLRTGDLGFLDNAGLLTLMARKGEVVAKQGMQIFPRAIEDLLVDLPGVSDAAVMATPNASDPAEIVAFVVPVSGMEFDLTAVEMQCRKRLPPPCQPSKFLVIPELPRSSFARSISSATRRSS
jgi:long-chain acyl-CoA synthetase